MAISFKSSQAPYKISRNMSYSDTQKIKERALEHVVQAIIELEENKTRTYICQMLDESFIVSKSMYSSYFKVVVTIDSMTIYWMSDRVDMKRAKCEEELFQMMCLDDTYCDKEFEEGIKLLVELHIQRILKQCGIGGFKEGVYDNQPNCE